MAEIDASLVIEHLKRIQERLGRLEEGQGNLIQRVGAVEAHMAAFHATEVNLYAEIGQVRQRLDRIERRVSLKEEA